jgi:diketogulonate reductase-like aldo/keto reductase
MGLGTGGLIPGDETSLTIETALRMGYRMLDLAREYANEKTVALFFSNTKSDENYPLRYKFYKTY